MRSVSRKLSSGSCPRRWRPGESSWCPLDGFKSPATAKPTRLLTGGGRCYYARAGRLDEAFRCARQAKQIAGIVNDLRLSAWMPMVAEVFFYKGLWKSQTFSFNAQTEEYVDMLQAGIVDPAKVVRAALQNAASVAGLLVTTEAMITEIPKKESAPAMPGGGGMGGMGGMDY